MFNPAMPIIMYIMLLSCSGAGAGAAAVVARGVTIAEAGGGAMAAVSLFVRKGAK